MAAGDWYYQVWCHDGLDDIVTEVKTFKVRYDAQQYTDMLNSRDRYYTRPGTLPPRAYFMQPVLEEHLSVSTAAYFRRCLNEDRVRYTDNYDGHLMDFAKHMLPFIVEGIVHPLEPDYWRILDHGGWMKLFSSPVIGSGSINCYAVYTVCERVMLRLTREYGKRQSMVTVEMFNGERELLAWANDVPVAAYTLESDMIDLFCDRFRNVTMMMG